MQSSSSNVPKRTGLYNSTIRVIEVSKNLSSLSPSGLPVFEKNTTVGLSNEKKRRVDDIFIILEAIGVIDPHFVDGKRSKGSYVWRGKSGIAGAFASVGSSGDPKTFAHKIFHPTIHEKRSGVRQVTDYVMSEIIQKTPIYEIEGFSMRSFMHHVSTVFAKASTASAAAAFNEESEEKGVGMTYKNAMRRIYDVVNVMDAANVISYMAGINQEKHDRRAEYKKQKAQPKVPAATAEVEAVVAVEKNKGKDDDDYEDDSSSLSTSPRIATTTTTTKKRKGHKATSRTQTAVEKEKKRVAHVASAIGLATMAVPVDVPVPPPISAEIFAAGVEHHRRERAFRAMVESAALIGSAKRERILQEIRKASRASTAVSTFIQNLGAIVGEPPQLPIQFEDFKNPPPPMPCFEEEEDEEQRTSSSSPKQQQQQQHYSAKRERQEDDDDDEKEYYYGLSESTRPTTYEAIPSLELLDLDAWHTTAVTTGFIN